MQSAQDLIKFPQKIPSVIDRFKACLSKRKAKAIKEMWDNNAELRNAIKTLKTHDFDDAKSLLIKIISSNKGNKNEFIIEYLNQLNKSDIELLTSSLEDIKAREIRMGDNKTFSFYKTQLELLLETRIADINHNQQSFLQKEPKRKRNHENSTHPKRSIKEKSQPNEIILGNELIDNFLIVLKKRNATDILAMWDGNQALHNEIKSLSFDKSEILLKKVLRGNKGRENQCLIECLNLIGKKVVEKVKNEMEEGMKRKKLPSASKQKILNTLQKRLDDKLKHKNNIKSSKKRKAKTSNMKPSKKYKCATEQKIELIQPEWAELIANLPIPDEWNNFHLDLTMGKKLLDIPIETREELSIHCIRKEKSYYVVKINDIKKFSEEQKKYSLQSPIPTSTSYADGITESDIATVGEDFISLPLLVEETPSQQQIDDALSFIDSIFSNSEETDSEIKEKLETILQPQTVVAEKSSSWSPTIFGYQFNKKSKNIAFANSDTPETVLDDESEFDEGNIYRFYPA